jgi:hypothetical protein
MAEGRSVAADGRFAEMSNAKTDGIQWNKHNSYYYINSA